jgi:predicted Zn-dependent peptidase
LKKAESYFKELPAGRKGAKPKTKESQKRPKELVSFKDVDQSHLIVGFRAFDVFDKRRYPLQVAADIMGGGMSSRLFQKVREELGAAYYVRTDADLYLDHGLLEMSAGVEHEKIDMVLRAALKEFDRIAKEPVGVQELKRAKEHLIGNLFMALEGSDELASFYAAQEIFGLKLATPQEVARSINAVTADQIRGVMGQIVRNDRLNLAVIGPFKKRSFLDILKV